MRICLVQHGECLSADIDPDRPLSHDGRMDVETLAAFLAKLGKRVSHLLHSGKTRARQTADLLQWTVAPGQKPDAREGLGPNDPVAPLAEEVSSSDENVLVVGHMPFLGRLASRLVVGQEDVAVALFVPGTAVCLERGDEGKWEIVWMVRPDLLAAEE